jgi:ribosomal protein S18 acetylase RimI-like enzyme
LAEKWLARQGHGELYIAVAEIDGAPAGRRCLNVEHYAAIGAGYCFAASVLPQWRSRGIGAIIDAHLAAVALKKGLRVLRCVVEKSNPRARSWHERLGYRVTAKASSTGSTPTATRSRRTVGSSSVRWTPGLTV